MATYKYPATGGGAGDVTGPASSVDSEIVLFDGTTGKDLKRATGTGFVKVVSGVMQTPNASVNLTSEVTGVLPVANGGTNSSTALNNNRVMRSSGGAVVEAAAITASRALISDANGIPTHATTTSTEIGYVNGVTSAIQTQLDGKQATGSYITALTGDVTASGPGSVAATVALVGGAAAADVASATTLANAATSSNTVSAIVRRDGSGNFSAGTITAALTGNVTGNVSGSAASITGVNPVANGGTNSSAALNNNRVMVSSGSAIVEASAITASRALVSNANGIPTHATTTSTEIGYVNGVTSAIQTQLDAKLCPTSVAAVSSDITLTNKRIHFVDTSAARSLTLPSPSTSSYIVIKDSIGSAQTNNITIVRSASEKIETVAASFTLNTNLGSWTFVSDGTDWFII